MFIRQPLSVDVEPAHLVRVRIRVRVRVRVRIGVRVRVIAGALRSVRNGR